MPDQTTPKVPTRKSEMSRAALVTAGRQIIARDGFANARIVDIAATAGKAVGVFYAYFPNKYELFSALLEEFFKELESSSPNARTFKGSEFQLVSASVKAFWKTSQKFRGDIKGLFEIAPTDPALLAIWRRMRSRGMRRFSSAIRRQQALNLCKELDPVLGASALMGLLEFTCFNWQACGLDFADQHIDEQCAINTLVTIIANTLEMTEFSPEETS